MIKPQHSIPLSLVESMLDAARHKGIDLAQVCDDAGLPDWMDVIESHDASARLSLDDWGSFLIALWRHMQDEASGFLTHPLKLGTFSMMCHALISAGNARRAILRSARYISLLTDDLHITLEESGNEARVVFEWDNSNARDEVFFMTSLFVIWIRLSCWLIERPILLDRVEFTFERPGYADEFEHMFPCRHGFSKRRNLFAFNKRILAFPIKQDPHTLVHFLNHAPQSLLTQYRADDSTTAQIKRLLIHNASPHGEANEGGYGLSSAMSFEEVAECLSSTTHTLRRRLKEEGHSYQEIKDSVRREQALALLHNIELSVQEISERLGFSEPAAFNRAFKKWTGKTPAAHRDELY